MKSKRPAPTTPVTTAAKPPSEEDVVQGRIKEERKQLRKYGDKGRASTVLMPSGGSNLG